MNKIIFEEKRRGVWGGEYFKASDYTGRWMIQTINNTPTLFIECFDIEEIAINKKGNLYADKAVYDSIWKRIIDKPSRYEKKWSGSFQYTEKKVKANVRWVCEDDVRVVTQTINECSGECNEYKDR